MRSNWVFLSLLGLPSMLNASSVTVHNSAKPLWDKSHRIEFAPDLAIGEEDGDESEIFGRIAGITADSQGRIIVADAGQNVVRRFGADGTFQRTIGRDGEGPGEYRNLTAIAVDAKDNVYVAGMHRVSEFDAVGEYVKEFREITDGYPRDLDVMSDGSVLVGSFDRPSRTVIQKYMAGERVLGFCEALKEGGDIGPMELFTYAGGYAGIDRDGTICFTQMTPYEIRKFTPAGELTMRVLRDNDFPPPRIEKSGDSVTIYPFAGSFAIFVLADGRFVNFVSIPSGSDKPGTTVVDLFDRGGHLLLSQSIDHPFLPCCMDSGGRVYAVDQSDVPAVVRYQMTIR